MSDEQTVRNRQSDPEVSEFWQEYWKIARQQAPQLRMARPRRKAARSGLVRFDPLGLHPAVRLVHKVQQGYVDLEFSGLGKRLEELQRVYGMFLERNMSIQRAIGSGAIRILVDVLDPKLPFAAQARKVSAAISEAHWLLDWFRMQMLMCHQPPS